MTCDISALDNIIDVCSGLSNDKRLTAEQKKDLETHGSSLKKTSAYIKEKLKVAEDIDIAIKKMNETLAHEEEVIVNVSAVIENLRVLIKLLDYQLFKAALFIASDIAAFTLIVNKCLDYSMDGRFKAAQRAEFLACGKRFRELLLFLVSPKFEQATSSFEKANADIRKISNALADEAALLNNISSTIANIARMVKTLDDLIKLVGSLRI